MPALSKNTKSTVIPVLRYRDASAAIEWLCKAFGFEKHLMVPQADGSVSHAQLSFGNGMIMLASVAKDISGVLAAMTRGDRGWPGPPVQMQLMVR